MAEQTRVATTAKQNMMESGGLASVGLFAAAVYARLIPEASIEEASALAAFLPAALNYLLHRRRDKKSES